MDNKWDRLVTPEDVNEAWIRIRPWVRQTPAMTCSALNERCQARVVLKCENLQKVGAFKFRGAINAVLQLSDEQRIAGVVTHSSGNHAQALALAARLAGTKATIVMPNNAPAIKREATLGYGATIVPCEPNQAARESAAARVVTESGATLIHPYDHPHVVAGQGTAAVELLDEVAGLDTLLAPVGGGGLLSGTALAAQLRKPTLRVVGCEPLGADDAWRSLYGGVRVTAHTPKTISDGLLTVLGDIAFITLSTLGVPIVRVTDEETVAAMRFVWERAKIIIEPSSAVPVAALMFHRDEIGGNHIGIILSGGNVDLTAFFETLRHRSEDLTKPG
ncbi:MAG: threonine/serine dehydratase [Myxococcales bacterium]|nr:threonine/serine dehydratase [Myxococcales bacterium]